MKKTIFLTFFCILLLSACIFKKKKFDNITESKMKWLPYSLNDTITFINNFGARDTWVLDDFKVYETSYGVKAFSVFNPDVRYYYKIVYTFKYYVEGSYIRKYEMKLTKDDTGDTYVVLTSNNSNLDEFSERSGTTYYLTLIESESSSNLELFDVMFKRGLGLQSYKSKIDSTLYKIQ